MNIIKNLMKSESISKPKLSSSKSASKKASVSKSINVNKSVNKSKSKSGSIENRIHAHIKKPDTPYVYYDAFLDDAQKEYYKKPIGIFDPHGENVNPFTGLPYQNLYIENKPIKYDSGPAEGSSVPNTYRNWSYIWTNLPLYTKVGEIVDSIRNHNMTIVKAGTGTGKSFLAGRICAQAFNFQKKVIMTLPKKLLALDAADKTAMSCDVRVGEEVGYKYKGAHEVNKGGKESKIIFTTTGTLVRQITGDDPFLKEYSCIIVDEAHERSVQTDEIILFLKRALAHRADLKVVFMSATLDTKLFMDYFSDYSCNLVELPNVVATFPVKDIYEKRKPEDWQKAAIEKVMEILRSGESGDILVFIKSSADANKMISYLQPQLKTLTNKSENPFMITLDAKIPTDEKDYALKEFNYQSHPTADPSRPFTRKIVFSTNVAESSLTVKGAVFVVDCGLALEDLYEPRRDANALLEKYVSQSAIIQRRGRVGRTKPGICYHLYSEAEMKTFPEFPIPSIQKSDLSLDLLDMMKMEDVKHVGDMKKLLASMISPPSRDFVDSALNNLYTNGAISSKTDDGAITMLGRAYSQFSGLTIPMARAIIASYYYHCKYDIIPMMVIIMNINGRIDGLYDRFRPRGGKMNERDFLKAQKEHEKKQHQWDSSEGDFMTIYNIYQAFRAFMKIPKPMESLNVPQPQMGGANLNNNNHSLNKNNTIPAVIPIEQLTKKTAADARRWCMENGIDHRVFVDSRNKTSWDKVGNDVRKIENTLMKIVQPPELRRQYFEKYKEEGGVANKRQLEKEMTESKKALNQITPPEDRLNAPEIDRVSIQDKSPMNENAMKGGRKREEEEEESPLLAQYIQYGGYNAKPFEINYFPNAQVYEKKEDNIMAALGHGFFTHMVKHVNKNFYRTCVPLEPVACYPDMKSTVGLKAKPKYLIYNELFMLRENQPSLKLNIVGKLPTKIQAEIKSAYGDLIKECYSSAKVSNNRSRKTKTKKVVKKKKHFTKRK